MPIRQDDRSPWLSRRLLLIGLAGLAPAAAFAQDATLHIYAAATFRAGLDAVLAAYRKGGGKVEAIYGPTPVLVQQMAQGAPADIFLSADPHWMGEAAKRGLVRPETRVTLMANDLVLIGPESGGPPRTIDASFPIATLLGGGHLAMCDPANDPAGRFAKQSLQSIGLWTQVQGSIAVAENTLGAVILVDRGEAAAAVVFATDVRGAHAAHVVGTFPEMSHSPILYPAALTTHAQADAGVLLAFLQSAEAAGIFHSFGYRPAFS